MYKHSYTKLHALLHRHTHTHTHTLPQSYAGKLVFQFIYPPKNSQYLVRLADKIYHTHMRQCCQYAAVLSLHRAVKGFQLQACDARFYFGVSACTFASLLILPLALSTPAPHRMDLICVTHSKTHN